MTDQQEQKEPDKKGKKSVIIKRVTVVAGGHHGGAWKVAFADFAISMMALFLVLWIMGATTEEERKQLADSIESNAIVQLDGSESLLEGAGGNTVLEDTEAGSVPSNEPGNDKPTADDPDVQEALARQAAYYESQKQLGNLAESLTEASQEMGVGESVDIEVVEQGVRLRFKDQAKQPLFASGSRELSGYFVKILRELGPVLAKVNNGVMISGHSDGKPLNNAFYSNWELSTERAISARHVLVQSGMPVDRVVQLAGYAETMPIEGKDPMDGVNRRIEVLILTKKGQQDLKDMFKGAPANTTPAASGASPTAPEEPAISLDLPEPDISTDS